MIQELFGASASRLLNQDQNLPISTPIEPSPSPSHSPSSSTTTTTPPTTTTTTSDHQKLRCPRCDSSHTKFCYYNNYNLTQPRHNNYNLTQPRHFCRRYWTKGGALRNVPIGGGCRKNKQTTGAGKLKSLVSSDLGKPSFMHGLELDQSNHNPNNIIWSHPPQTSHLLSLFRATQNPNPNFTSNTLTHMKDHNFMGGSHMGSLGFESLCSSLWKNNQQYHQNQHQDHDHDQAQGIMSSSTHEGVQNQRLRSSSSSTTNYYHHEETGPLILGSNVANMTSSATSSSTILDSAPVIAVGDVGFWNQSIPWTTSDLAASNGAYP